MRRKAESQMRMLEKGGVCAKIENGKEKKLPVTLVCVRNRMFQTTSSSLGPETVNVLSSPLAV